MELQSRRDVASSSSSNALAWHARRERGTAIGEVQDIITIEDPVCRNLRITLGYHDLTVAMSDLLGRENVSWVAFAAWASRTAGRFIRQDYMPGIVRSYMEKLAHFHRGVHFAHNLLSGVRGRNAKPSRSLLEASVERLSLLVTETVAAGNLSVFADIAPAFARMIEWFRGAECYKEDELEAFLATLNPGPVDEDGQELLIIAFRNYYHAMFERDPKAKAEHILLANNLCGYHEQNRLQKYIFRSLNAPVASLIADAANDRARELTHQRIHKPVRGVVERMMQPFTIWLQNEWASVATRWLMRIDVPGQTFSLGADLPNRCEHYMFPKDLMTIENPELSSLLARLDYTPDTVQGSAAKNWGRLEDRMNFIVDLFRTRQQDDVLFSPPFTEEQIASIRRNVVPPGDL
jgi:hypothetical protein